MSIPPATSTLKAAAWQVYIHTNFVRLARQDLAKIRCTVNILVLLNIR